jgi:7-cyano-7-deazaguanine synthase
MTKLVLLSGGIDSAVLLYKEMRDSVLALSIDYGQRHSKELKSAASIAEHAMVQHQVVELPVLREVMRGSYLTDDEGSVVVPNRNMILISIAIAHAMSEGCNAVCFGAHHDDHAVFQDCRPRFFDGIRSAVAPFEIETPFIHRPKSYIVTMGRELGVPMEKTWTCYAGGKLHCGVCSACTGRIAAFRQAGVDDPVEYEANGD